MAIDVTEDAVPRLKARPAETFTDILGITLGLGQCVIFTPDSAEDVQAYERRCKAMRQRTYRLNALARYEHKKRPTPQDSIVVWSRVTGPEYPHGLAYKCWRVAL